MVVWLQNLETPLFTLARWKSRLKMHTQMFNFFLSFAYFLPLLMLWEEQQVVKKMCPCKYFLPKFLDRQKKKWIFCRRLNCCKKKQLSWPSCHLKKSLTRTDPRRKDRVSNRIGAIISNVHTPKNVHLMKSNFVSRRRIKSLTWSVWMNNAHSFPKWHLINLVLLDKQIYIVEILCYHCLPTFFLKGDIM